MTKPAHETVKETLDDIGILTKLYMAKNIDNGCHAQDKYSLAAEESVRKITALLDTHVLVPRKPTEEMWGGLARAIMMGRDLNCHKANDMRDHLENCGHEIPHWLDQELKDNKHLAKGDMCAIIYKAMLASYESDNIKAAEGE